MNALAWSKCVRTGRWFGTSGMLTAALVGGCQAERPSDRVDPYSEPGPATLNDPGVSPRTLLEFTDQVNQSLADRIPTITEIRSAPQKVVLAGGAITNRTRTPSNDFLAVRSKIFSTMVNSNVAQHAIILDNIEDMDEQVNRYAQPGGPDRLDEGGGGGGLASARYDPAIVYILNGEFSEISRAAGRDSTYIFNWKLVSLKTSQVVYADTVTSTQTRTR